MERKLTQVNVMNKLLIVAIILAVLAALSIISVTTKSKITESSGLSYQELCVKNGDQWMVMEPWRDGKKMPGEPCTGCMIGGNHYCSQEEYLDHIKKMRSSDLDMQNHMNEMMEQMDDMDHGMIHTANVVNGGNLNQIESEDFVIKFNRERLRENALEFEILQDGKPVNNLEIVHEKIMHVILVRNDLEYFDHLHPEKTGDGKYAISFEFLSGGSYRLWTDFTVTGKQKIISFDFEVSASEKPGRDKLGGLEVKMVGASEIISGKQLELKFEVLENGNKVPIKEKFLGANAHIIGISQDLDEFGHMHDEDVDGDNLLEFNHVFSKKGLHKIWVQFSVYGLDRTAEFSINVL